MKIEVTLSGGLVADLNKLKPEHLDLNVIAKGLSKLCRFGGHTDQFYSVAQHSIIVSKLVPPSLAFAALMHDASEAYVQDLVTPIKRQLPDYEDLELMVMSQLAAYYDIADHIDHPEVKRADKHAQAIEMHSLFPEGEMVKHHPWIQTFDLPHRGMPCWTPDEAAAAFKERFMEVAPTLVRQIAEED
ncbi:HD domain protein [Vibrio phage 2.117.O._10N.261.45.E9]|nr:HD domain protein [Vibrio phage 1.117.O._10N.261.45.E9]AUR95468.1 HD domain protein [Vibrio phage 1.207.B._10N.222.51.C2]AUS02359.1 HD domain protein [Vibrio phage 2.117.O._10N.261.45.E9]